MSGFGRTSEFTLAKRENDKIIFLLSHRHYDLDTPKPVEFHSSLAEPMRLALSGRSGTVICPDYRGQEVLAAYEPVKELGLDIVAKLDLREIQAPFVRAAIVVIGVMFVFVILGAALFIRISRPIVLAIEKKNEELLKSNKELAGEIESR